MAAEDLATAIRDVADRLHAIARRLREEKLREPVPLIPRRPVPASPTEGDLKSTVRLRPIR